MLVLAQVSSRNTSRSGVHPRLRLLPTVAAVLHVGPGLFGGGGDLFSAAGRGRPRGWTGRRSGRAVGATRPGWRRAGRGRPGGSARRGSATAARDRAAAAWGRSPPSRGGAGGGGEPRRG